MEERFTMAGHFPGSRMTKPSFQLLAHGMRVGDFGSRHGAAGEGPSPYLFDPEGNLVEWKGPAARDDA